MSKKKQAKLASKKPAGKMATKGKPKASKKRETGKGLKTLAAMAAKLTTKALGSKAPASKALPKKAPKAAAAKPVKLAKTAKPAVVAAPVKAPKPVKGAKAPVVAVAPAAPAKGPGRPPKGAKGAAPAAAEAPAKKGRPAKAASRPYESDACRETACETTATTSGYCRLHYIKNWKKIKRKELILKEKKLNQYIEELVSKYPEKYIEAIRQDLADEKAFAKVIYDLELDENVEDIEIEGENDEDIIEGIKRGGFDEGDPEF